MKPYPMTALTPAALRDALFQAWSLDSSSKWTAENPAAGHCGVTALVAQDWLGGDILKTRYGPIWHFYNRIDGERIDFTNSQFNGPISYDDAASNRQEAFADTNDAQYAALSERVREALTASAE